MVVYSRLYQQLYPLVCQIGAPVFGIGVTVLAVIAAAHGVSLIATVVLVSIYIYLHARHGVLLGARLLAAGVRCPISSALPRSVCPRRCA